MSFHEKRISGLFRHVLDVFERWLRVGKSMVSVRRRGRNDYVGGEVRERGPDYCAAFAPENVSEESSRPRVDAATCRPRAPRPAFRSLAHTDKPHPTFIAGST